MADRLFTLEEALALLPAVRQMLIEVRERKKDVEERSAKLEAFLASSAGNGHRTESIEQMERELRVSASGLQQLMSELDATGVELKGIDDGLLDFRSMRDGRVVYLCWRFDEPSISWWHELDTGFAGRQPL